MHYKQFFIATARILASVTTIFYATHNNTISAATTPTNQAFSGHIEDSIVVTLATPTIEDTAQTHAKTAATTTIELMNSDTEDDPDLDYLKDLNPDAPVALSALKEEPSFSKKCKMALAVAKEKIKATSKRAVKHLSANKGKWLLGTLGLGTTIAMVKLCTGGNNPPPQDDNDPKQSKK